MRLRSAAAVIVCLSCIELGAHVFSRLEYVQAKELYAPPPIVRDLMQRSAETPGRFVGATEDDSYPHYQGDNLPPNVASVFGLDDVRGFVPVPTLHQELVMAMAENATHPAHFPGAVHLSNLASPWLDRVGARYVMATRDQVPEHFRKIRPGSPSLYDNPRAAPIVSVVACAEVAADEASLVRRVVSQPWKGDLTLGADAVRALGELGLPVLGCETEASSPVAVLTRDISPGSFEAEVQAPARGGYLRIARSFSAGFSATINTVSLPVLRGDYALQFIPLPPGHSHVVVRYEPESVAFGLRMSAAALMGIVLLGLLALNRRRRA